MEKDLYKLDVSERFIDEELASLFGKYTKLHPENHITIGVGVQTINPKILKLKTILLKNEIIS